MRGTMRGTWTLAEAIAQTGWFEGQCPGKGLHTIYPADLDAALSAYVRFWPAAEVGS